MAHCRARAAAFLAVAALGLPSPFHPESVAVPPKRTPTATSATARNPKKSVPAERQVALRWFRGMKLQDMVAQLVVITTYGEAPPKRTKEYREIVHAISSLRVGGIIAVNRVVNGSVRQTEPYKMAAFVNRMQKLSRVPLLVGADFERGASMRVNDTVKFPHLMAYGAANDLNLTRQLGRATAREARALGVQWVFAPDADVNNNPENPIINTRSFGEDPALVSAHVRAFIEGAHSDPLARVLTTAKHFPGHGDTNTDTHLGMATLTADRARLDAVELVPFRSAIESGVDAVMTAHMAVPAVEPEAIPATISSKVLTGMLRDELGFEGLIVTDAMEMQGLAKQYSSGEASVRAIEAGADVLLMPPDPDAAVQAVVRAVREGRISKKRVEASAMRVLMAKARVGLHRSKLIDAENLVDALDSPEAAQEAQQAADEAVTMIRNQGSILPLKSPETSCLYVLAENRYGQQGRTMLAEVKRIAPKMRAMLLDSSVPAVEVTDVVDKSRDCATVVVAAYFRLPGVVEGFTAMGKPVVLMALGSPYVLRSFPEVDGVLATFSSAPTSEIAALKALLGLIPVRGHMPVSVPGVANVGDGLSTIAP